MRRFFGKDSKYLCIPAGALASLTFCLYRNNTIALYVMLKALQVPFLNIISVLCTSILEFKNVFVHILLKLLFSKFTKVIDI